MSQYDPRRHSAVVEGRPDFQDHEFGRTLATRHPAYAYSRHGAGLLVHRVAAVEFSWYEPVGWGQRLARLRSPRVTIRLVCGPFRHQRSTAFCAVPSSKALLCGRCHEIPATFGRDGVATRLGVPKSAARRLLGCMPELVV